MSWTLFALVAVPVFIVMMRLDRLGKQIEAVCHLIQLEIAENNPDRKHQLLSDSRQEHEQTKKDTRQFWMFWGGLVAFVLVGGVFWLAGITTQSTWVANVEPVNTGMQERKSFVFNVKLDDGCVLGTEAENEQAARATATKAYSELQAVRDQCAANRTSRQWQSHLDLMTARARSLGTPQGTKAT
jgi:hypothetical protein